MKCVSSTYPFLVVLFFCFLISGPPAAWGEDRQESRVCFRWAFGAMVGPEGDQRLVAITRDTVLKTGDRLKLLIQLKTLCYVYLLYRSDEDDLLLLFPYDLNQFDAEYITGQKYYIPQGSNWFELDENVGVERFYLLASAERLTALESLYKKYLSVDGSDKTEFAHELLDHIRTIRQKYHKFSSAAERPVAIGGNVRSAKKDDRSALPDVDPIASEVTAHHFYGKTFTIEHK